VHHRTIQINHQPNAKIFQFIILTSVYSSTCFWRFPAHHQELNDCSGSLWFYLRIVVTVVLCSWSGRPKHIELVNKRQENKLENCCIWLVIYLNCTMMHGLKTLNKIHVCCFSHPLVRSVYGNNYFQNYDLEGNLPFNSVLSNVTFRTLEGKQLRY